MVINTVGSALKYGKKFLKDSGDDTFRIDAEVLLKYTLKCDDIHLITHCDDEISDDSFSKYLFLLKRRGQCEPVAYIINNKEFMSLDFYVDKNVLIPRPDTETAVCMAIEIIKNDKMDVLDLCTGSGAIGVSIAHYCKNANVVCADISEKALDIARYNAQKNKVDERCSFINIDVLKNLSSITEKFDIVISNPPYIKSSQMSNLMKDVKDFEPHIALFGGDDGLVFYRKIINQADKLLNDGAFLIFETGFDTANDVSLLMKDKFADIKILYDLSKNPRVVCAKKTYN